MEAIAVGVKDFELFCCPHFEKKKWHRNKELTGGEFEPGTPGSEITELPTKLQGCWRVQVIEKAINFVFGFFFSSELKTKMDRLYVLEDSVKKFVLEKF